MDDDIRADPVQIKALAENYVHRPIAFDLPSGLTLSLRDVCNKIIHTRKFYWHDKTLPYAEQLKALLASGMDHDLIILEGDLSGKPWTVGVSLIGLAEQFYDYAEVACEYCGS